MVGKGWLEDELKNDNDLSQSLVKHSKHKNYSETLALKGFATVIIC